MTTVNEKLRALAEEIESDREEWASLAETAITAHTANERGARAAAHREDARRLRAILDAPPASPEAPAPDLTALVEAYGEAVGALHSWGGAPRQARATAAEAALLSAISRAVSEARAAAELRAEEAERERDEARKSGKWLRERFAWDRESECGLDALVAYVRRRMAEVSAEGGIYDNGFWCVDEAARAFEVDAESFVELAGRADAAAALASRVSALEGALRDFARPALRDLMSDISEEYYCAGWLIGTEFTLWGMVRGGDRRWGLGVVTEEEVVSLRRLAGQAGGWWAYSGDYSGDCEPGENGPVFLPADLWVRAFAAGPDDSGHVRAQFIAEARAALSAPAPDAAREDGAGEGCGGVYARATGQLGCDPSSCSAAGVDRRRCDADVAALRAPAPGAVHIPMTCADCGKDNCPIPTDEHPRPAPPMECLRCKADYTKIADPAAYWLCPSCLAAAPAPAPEDRRDGESN